MHDLNAILKNLDWNHRRPFGWGSSPDADWKVIFVGTVIGILLVSVFSFLLFFQVEKGWFLTRGEGTPSEPPTLDVEKLESTLSLYEKRAAEFQRLVSGSVTVVGDPSI